MPFDIEFTRECEEWWFNLNGQERESLAFSIDLLEEFGFHLKRPHADTVHNSKFPNMRELRCQHQGRPYRILYAFDPNRMGILLIGGDKTGKSDWYRDAIPKADKLYEAHLKTLEGKRPSKS